MSLPEHPLSTTPLVEVVIPVHNEVVALPLAIERLTAHLEGLPWRWRITIADSGSTDETALVARRLLRKDSRLHLVSVSRPGRGRALKHAWRRSPADVLVYMDVDLSTDLADLAALVLPLADGTCDVAIGSRLDAASHVTRGLRRDVLSRGYNLLLRWTVKARFSDAQCGFKAVRREVADALLPQVVDDEWFFDTELLLLAQRRGLRIHEVPVTWVDDPDSRVRLMATIWADLRGIWRLR